ASVADARLTDLVPGLEACTAVPDPAPRFVKWGAGCAQQSHEEHSIVELVGCDPHAFEAPKLEMDTLRNTRPDRSTAHQSRAQIRSIVRSPRPRDGQLVGLDTITLQILERTTVGHGEFVCEGGEFPALPPGVSAAHQRVAPI